MNSDSAFNYFEILMLALFVAGWGVLEWQGKRLDRKREAERAKRAKKHHATVAPRSTHPSS